MTVKCTINYALATLCKKLPPVQLGPESPAVVKLLYTQNATSFLT